MRQIPRLFQDQLLTTGLHLFPESGQIHYLLNVLRLTEGAEVILLDDQSGEWRARIIEAGKKRLTLSVEEMLRPREEVPDLWLLTAPIRRERFQWIVEKATELGVARICPVKTERTNNERLNETRLRAHMIEAAEQCERTALPLLEPLQPLTELLANWPAERQLIFCDEAGGVPMSELQIQMPAAILIGPEGGFSDHERQLISSCANSHPITLGPNILRADTAVVAAIAQFQVIAAARQTL